MLCVGLGSLVLFIDNVLKIISCCKVVLLLNLKIQTGGGNMGGNKR